MDDEWLMSVPDPLIHEDESCFSGFYDLGAPWGDDPTDPWVPELTCDHYMAPFDQEVSTTDK